MDKKSNSYSWECRERNGRCKIVIIVFNGEITKCYYHRNTYYKEQSENFNKVLRNALKELAEIAPETFMEVYQSLYLSSRGYKIATEVRDAEIVRLKTLLKELEI